MKSIYQILGEVTEKLAEAGKFKEYVEKSKDCTSIESKISCAESVLKTVKTPSVKESRGPVTKNNGARDNGGEEFRESGTAETLKEVAKSDAALYKMLGINEADQRRLRGLPSAGENLTAPQLREYRFLRSIRLSESDALKGARKVA